MAPIGKLISGALIAAPLGSVVGAAVSVWAVTSDRTEPDALMGVTLLIAAVGSLVSFLAVLFVGVPLTWPFREAIWRRPLPFAALYGVVGCLLGIWVALVAGLAGQDTLVPAMAIGGASAIAWIWVMCRNRAWLA